MTPRRLAVKALIHQEQAGYANLVLDAELKKCTPPLDSRDAAFAARIFYTTLERLPLLDYRINQFTKKPVAKLDAPVRAVLRAGLAQALYMNVPLPAAVNESKNRKHKGETIVWHFPCCNFVIGSLYPGRMYERISPRKYPYQLFRKRSGNEIC